MPKTKKQSARKRREESRQGWVVGELRHSWYRAWCQDRCTRVAPCLMSGTLAVSAHVRHWWVLSWLRSSLQCTGPLLISTPYCSKETDSTLRTEETTTTWWRQTYPAVSNMLTEVIKLPSTPPFLATSVQLHLLFQSTHWRTLYHRHRLYLSTWCSSLAARTVHMPPWLCIWGLALAIISMIHIVEIWMVWSAWMDRQ